MASPILAAARLALVCTALAACSPVVNQRGNLVPDDRLSQIQPGVSRAEDVAALLGAPSATGTFDPNAWYYIGQVTAQRAFFEPEVVDRRVVVVTFDDSGVVASIEELNEEDGQEVALVERTTPTAGRELGLLEQLLGNLGRFNDGGPSVAVPRAGR